MKIALYGGSFNPPHLGHIAAARSVLAALNPDRIIMIPAAVPPHKEWEEGSPSGDDRLKTLELLTGTDPEFGVSDIEIRRGGVSYTSDTVEEFRKQYPEAEIFLLMGMDMLESFENWYSYRYLLENTVLAVFKRSGGDGGRVLRGTKVLRERYGARVEIIEHEPIEISSTELRALLKKREGIQFLNDEAYSYIIRKRLYDSKPHLDWLREKAMPYMDEDRVAHIDGCRDEAVKLAIRWGADESDAAEVAILHDITKKCPHDEQLLLCDRYAIITDDVEKKQKKLLHAKTGAALARLEFGVPDGVYGAILWHTTGKADMTLLEKIIYIADYIEPNRDFEGVEELRRLAYEDLDAAMELGLTMSLEELRSKDMEPHSRSLEALEWLEHRKDMISQ